MNIKNICKNFKKNGFVVIPKFLSKAEIKIIFSQLNELIDVPIKSINVFIAGVPNSVPSNLIPPDIVNNDSRSTIKGTYSSIKTCST